MKACCEFSRKVQINQIQKKPLTIKVEANDEEKKALARRFSIPELHSLTCTYHLRYFHGRQVRAEGDMKASITQNCVVSLEDFTVKINESFELLFIPAEKLTSELEEIDDPDVIPYENEVIDLGEVTAEQLALLIEPYPHKKGAGHTSIITGEEKNNIKLEQKENPFKILQELKNRGMIEKK